MVKCNRAPILGDKDEPNRISTRPKADNMCTTMELAPVFCTFIVRSLLAQAQPMRLGARINPDFKGDVDLPLLFDDLDQPVAMHPAPGRQVMPDTRIGGDHLEQVTRL